MFLCFMKRFNSVLFPVVVLSAVANQPFARGEEQSWSITSPNGLIKMSLALSGSGQVSYQVDYGPEGGRNLMIRPSPMGLILKGHDFSRSLKLDGAEAVRNVAEHYEL